MYTNRVTFSFFDQFVGFVFFHVDFVSVFLYQIEQPSTATRQINPEIFALWDRDSQLVQPLQTQVAYEGAVLLLGCLLKSPTSRVALRLPFLINNVLDHA